MHRRPYQRASSAHSGKTGFVGSFFFCVLTSIKRPARFVCNIPRRGLAKALRQGSRRPLAFTAYVSVLLILFMIFLPKTLEFMGALAAWSPAFATLTFASTSAPLDGHLRGRSQNVHQVHARRLFYVYWLLLGTFTVLDASDRFRWFPLGPAPFYTFLKAWLFVWMHWFGGVSRVYDLVICPFVKAKDFPERTLFAAARRNVDEILRQEENNKKAMSNPPRMPRP